MSCTNSFIGIFYQTFMREILTILQKLIQKKKKEEQIPNKHITRKYRTGQYSLELWGQ